MAASGGMTNDLAALRVREDQIFERLREIRLQAETRARRAADVDARLGIHARSLDVDAPFRTPDPSGRPDGETPPELRDEETRLMIEAERVRRLVELRGVRRGLPLLDSALVASACSARWTDMVGGHRVRHCARCAKEVYDLSQLGDREAEQLLRERAGACTRLHRREDGTVLTADCPSGVRRRLFERIGLGVAVGVVLALVAVELAPVLKARMVVRQPGTPNVSEFK